MLLPEALYTGPKLRIHHPGAAGSQDGFFARCHICFQGVKRQLNQFAAPVHLSPSYVGLQRCKLGTGD